MSGSKVQRVVVANEPRLFREMLIHAMSRTPGLEVVAAVDDIRNLANIIQHHSPDVVIFTRHLPDEIARKVKRLAPSLQQVAVSRRGEVVEVTTGTSIEEQANTKRFEHPTLLELINLIQ